MGARRRETGAAALVAVVIVGIGLATLVLPMLPALGSPATSQRVSFPRTLVLLGHPTGSGAGSLGQTSSAPVPTAGVVTPTLPVERWTSSSPDVAQAESNGTTSASSRSSGTPSADSGTSSGGDS